MKYKNIILCFLLSFSIILNIFLLNSYSGERIDELSKDVQDNRRYIREYDPYIFDAKRRWSSRNYSSEDPFRNRTTSVVTLDDRICVSFEYSQPDIGGAPPFYCYSFDGVKLISKRDEVE